MDTVKVSFKPTKVQLNQIKDWLVDEDKVSDEGFFCNWENIEHSFNERKLGTIILNREVIGFITWFDHERVADIVITEIKPPFRKMGYGRILVESLTLRLKKQGISILKLHCQPPESIYAWKQLGFLQYPEIPEFNYFNSDNGKHLYKIIMPYKLPAKTRTTSEYLELWSVEPYMASRYPSAWKWNLDFETDSNRLKKPIIFPAKPDWNICWVGTNGKIEEEKVKRFGKKDIDFNNFIIIEELP